MMQDYTREKELFLSKFSSRDDRIDRFDKMFSTWAESLSDDVIPIVFDLLSNFDYYTHSTVNRGLRELHQKLHDNYNIDDREAVHTIIPKNDGRFDSSLEYLTEYRQLNEIQKVNCYHTIGEITDEEWDNISYIVIVDDICGSGHSLCTFLENQKKNFSDKTIYYLTIHFMNQSNEAISKLEKDYNVRIISISLNNRNKAFDLDDIMKYEDARERIRSFSRKLCIPKGRVFGQYRSEALVAFYNNTPNNTIGLFCYSTDSYDAPFPRSIEQSPSWKSRPTPSSMKRDKEIRKQNNYNAKTKQSAI